jgi:hypothetical protein
MRGDLISGVEYLSAKVAQMVCLSAHLNADKPDEW